MRSVKFRFMNETREWDDALAGQRPGTAGDGDRSRPAGVEFVIDLEDWGEIRRIVEVPG